MDVYNINLTKEEVESLIGAIENTMEEHCFGLGSDERLKFWKALTVKLMNAIDQPLPFHLRYSWEEIVAMSEKDK